MRLQRFDGTVAVNRFDCGHTPINRFLKNAAKKVERRFQHRVYAVIGEGSTDCLGYYALQLGSDAVSDLVKKRQDYVQTHESFPAVHLSWLAVDMSVQSQGLGKYLLMDVFEKAAMISDHAGFYALTLQSIDERATAFYQSIGFTTYVEGDQPRMLYPLEDILKLVRRE